MVAETDKQRAEGNGREQPSGSNGSDGSGEAMLSLASIAETESIESIGSVLVVGAGVAGIRAALDLAEVGYRVLLTDASPAIGGILSKLDYQFPNNHCGMCKMLPVVGREYASQYCMRKSLFHDNIKILPFTDVEGLSGEAGAFSVTLRQHPRYVDTDVCIGTGYCAEVCPVDVPDAFNQGLKTHKAIYQPVPHNLPNMYLIDMEACTRCGKCLDVCPVDAIDLDARSVTYEVEVDTVILAAGSGVHDPSTAPDLTSYAVSPDVVTSLEFERLLSASGSYDGLIRRPSDGAPAKRFAWLQCVGSRNRKAGRDYCSSICCMFALKEAVLAHEKGGPGVETSIFYMDMRTFGKDFYRYREHAEEDHGVRLVRCRVHNLEVEPDGHLRIRYFDQKGGSWREESFDMVVLSTGQAANTAGRELAAMLDVEADEMGFFLPCGFEKVKSAKEGVFVCGSFTGLTDIGEALTSASAAASQASKLMVELGKPFKGRLELPPERPVAREVPRVHVVLCQWNNGQMPEPVDLSNIAESLALQHGVGEVSVVETLCRGEGYDLACDLLRQSRCNRVLFGACLPYIYRQRLKTLARKAGFNPTLVEVVDIRSIIQRYLAEKDIPTLEGKVEHELFTALQKLRASDALALNSIPITQRALVVGGGMAGMRAALSLADRGIEVDLLERADELGGRPLKRLHFTLEGLDPAALARDLMQQVWEHKRIAVHKNAEILASNGSLGQFTTRIRNGENEEIDISHGAAIIATGGHEARTEEYCFGQSQRILTQASVEHRLATGALEPSALQTVVMIQCVGSRERGAREYCSRVCCAAALKNALKIREANPDAKILILYRDMMTYGHLERYYTEARGAGILFATYDLDDKPEVNVIDGKPVVRFFDQVLRRRVQVAADLLCLSTGIEPDASNAHLARLFGIELTRDGFFQEAESKWRPVDFLREGFFIAGTAHSPGPIAEAIAQAEAAAQRAFIYLSRKRVTTARVVSVTHHAICSRCQTCIEVCPFEARFFDPLEDRIVVDQAACQGCGMCAAACPNGAASVMGMNPSQAFAVIEASLAQHSY